MQRTSMICVLVLLTLLLTVQYVRCALRPVVRQTVNGPVEGVEVTSQLLSTKAYLFASIPYANPPITGRDPYTGQMVDRRFKAPEPLDRNWTQPLKVGMYGKTCIQAEEDRNEDEDCLFVSVYVPAGGAERKTVLVYFHGGNYAFGGGPLGVDFLLAQDNIVVSCQFRLGIFGYLNLNFGEYTGNMAMKDQQLVLKWVYENIEYFSGKKDEIMIFGVSSGASSVHLHMLNEESRKYFNRAFVISNTAFSITAMHKADHLDHIKECSKLNEMDDLVEYIKTSNVSTLRQCYSMELITEPQVRWRPTIEAPNAVDAFMTGIPEKILSSNKAPVMDAMFSFASQEAVAFYPDLFNMTEPLLKENLTQFDGSLFRIKFRIIDASPDSKEFKYTLERLRAAYFTNTSNLDAIQRANSAFLSDLWIADSVVKAAALQAEANTRNPDKSQHKNTFLFRFSANTELKNMVVDREYDGATHADLVPYIFQLSDYDHMKIYLKNKDDINRKIMQAVTMITNFARTGDPSIEGDTPFKSCQSANEIYCQEVSNEPKTRVMSDIKEQLHYDVWRDVENAVVYRNQTRSSSKADRLSQGLLLNICVYLVYFYVQVC